jgi:tripartite-type tricarboxylate transporter receptor subunit TctC
MPDVVEYLINTGVEVEPGTPEDLARFIRSETGKYRKIIEVAGIKLD